FANQTNLSKTRTHVISDQTIRRSDEPVSKVWSFLDLKPSVAQLRTAFADNRQCRAEFGGEMSRRQMDARGAKRNEQRNVESAHGSSSSEKSIAGAECVSAPTEIKSTPVAAIAGTLLRVTPPLASN